MNRKKICITLLASLLSFSAIAQIELLVPSFPPAREYHHIQIINSLSTISRLHSKKDSIFPVTGNYSLDQSINRSVNIRVNNLRAKIEMDTTLNDNAKFKWLRGVNEMLLAFISGYKYKIVSATILPGLVNAYDEAMKMEISGNSILPIIIENASAIGNILIGNFALKDNIGIDAGKDVLVLKVCQLNPKDILKILTKYPDNRYADSLIVTAAFQNQEELYNYASVPNALGKRIQTVNHPLVRIIGQLAVSKTGRMYFPFLDNLYRNKLSIDSITPYILNDSSTGYYRLLVKTRIDYAERMQHGDTPMAVKALTSRLKFKAIELYINEINALHDQPNEKIRFKKLEELGPEELYYLAVLSEEEIYTSSFVNGVYPRIFQKMDIPRSDSLLMRLHHDYYKKFIKICAAYNTLDNFLSRMGNNEVEKLMRSFVNGLETTTSLEDAVDVANSYASIYSKDLRKLILSQLEVNLAKNKQKNNKKGILIYDLLQTIFLSMDSVNKVDLTARLGIDPVYVMPKKLMEDSSGRVIIQQFSYGDKDAVVYFSAFLNKFTNANWKIIRKPNWVEINSVKGAPITIYANLPLDEKKELDILAQDSLISYLEDNNLNPKMVIHRGHSYYLQETINRLPGSAKVVLLGSCGGYQKLSDILDICPSAHIISSKQVAAGVLNQSLIDVITENLRLGKDLQWEVLWKKVQLKVGAGYKDKFDDYIPPHKNLGAIFIMAYEKSQAKEKNLTNQ